MNTDNPSHPRYNTNKILQLLGEGMLDVDAVLNAALDSMSDSDVADMAERNEFFPEEEDE